MRVLATAAQFAEPEIADTDMVDNIAVLSNYPGDRSWRFYRPDPQALQRPMRMDLRVTTEMSLSDIQRRIEAFWPDLVGGAPDWELVETAASTGRSFQLVGGFPHHCRHGFGQ